MVNKKQKNRVIVIGTGGHARVVLSILSYINNVEIIGLADRDKAFIGKSILGYKIITTWDQVTEFFYKGINQVSLAVGDNEERAQLFYRFKERGFNILGGIHPTAVIEKGLNISEGVIVCAGAIIGTQVNIGPNSIINTGSIIDHECIIGEHVHIAPGCSIAGRVSIKSKAFIGIGSVIKEKITIGQKTVVGAGSVVVKDIPDEVVAYGTPAEIKT